jgi:DNA-binding MarR family transcriptional regulator
MELASRNDNTSDSIKMIAEQCVAVRLRLVTRAVTKIYNHALRPHGLTVSQMNILAAVAYLNEPRQQDVCHALHLDRSTLSRDIERLRTQGWLDQRAGEDARTSLLRLTASGSKLLLKTLPAWEKAQREAIELLGKEQIDKLDRSTQALRSAVSKT